MRCSDKKDEKRALAFANQFTPTGAYSFSLSMSGIQYSESGKKTQKWYKTLYWRLHGGYMSPKQKKPAIKYVAGFRLFIWGG